MAKQFVVKGKLGGRSETLYVDARDEADAEVIATRSGLAVDEVRPLDFYDKPFRWLKQKRACSRCGKARMTVRRGCCHNCQREITSQKRKREEFQTAYAERAQRQRADAMEAAQAKMGRVRVGNEYHSPLTIRAVEPFELVGVFRAIWGPPMHGWDVHFFHGDSLRVSFNSPEEAGDYLGYLARAAPHIQVIRRETVTFWWVSF